jgi:hypothetical protein
VGVPRAKFIKAGYTGTTVTTISLVSVPDVAVIVVVPTSTAVICT